MPLELDRNAVVPLSFKTHHYIVPIYWATVKARYSFILDGGCHNLLRVDIPSCLIHSSFYPSFFEWITWIRWYSVKRWGQREKSGCCGVTVLLLLEQRLRVVVQGVGGNYKNFIWEFFQCDRLYSGHNSNSCIDKGLTVG